MRCLAIRLTSLFALLAVMHTASPAMAMTPCPPEVECGLNMGSMMGGPMGALGVLVGSLGTPLIANGISDKHLPYWALAVGNMLVSTATVAAVSAGTYDQFKEGQEGAYNGMCFLVPIGASILTSSIMLALAGRPDKVEPVDPMIPAVGMVITPQEQSLMLGWQF